MESGALILSPRLSHSFGRNHACETSTHSSSQVSRTQTTLLATLAHVHTPDRELIEPAFLYHYSQTRVVSPTTCIPTVKTHPSTYRSTQNERGTDFSSCLQVNSSKLRHPSERSIIVDYNKSISTGFAEPASSKLRLRTAFNSFRLKLPGTAHLPVLSSPARQKHPGLADLLPDTGAVPPLPPPSPPVARARPGAPQGPAHARARARRPPAHAGHSGATQARPSRRLARHRAVRGLGRVSAAPALPSPAAAGRRRPGLAAPARSPGAHPPHAAFAAPPRRRSPGPPAQPLPPLYPGRSTCVPRVPRHPAALRGPARVRAVLARTQVRAAPRRPPPAAAAARSRTRSAASSADMLEPPSPPPASPRSERRAGPGSARPPRPAAHWPPAPSAQPFLTVIGRCARRSRAGPAEKLSSDWVSLVCFGNYWLQLSSVKTTAHGLRLSPHFFFSGLAASAGLTEAAVSERPRPSQPPSRRPIPSLPAARFAFRPLAPGAATPAASLAPAAASPRGREPTRGCLILIGRCPCQSSAAGGAAERGAARAPSRSARRLVAGRARGARPPPCPTGGRGEYPYVRAITSPPANQGARGQASRPRGRGLAAPAGPAAPRTAPLGVPGLQRAGLEQVPRSSAFPSARGDRAPCPGSGDGGSAVPLVWVPE
uniref:proline-rich protein 36-like n=1 Tax=Lonchura striata TaxID=40157 RepID=UPI000B4CF62D|nr:proline-rich protein 36-like [Lonchura striata domestica]